MKKRILTAVIPGILMMITGAVNAQNTKPFSLKECVETAISNNLQVRQSAYQAQSDKITYQQAKGSQLPNLSGTVLHGINQGRSIDPYTNTYADQQINFATYSISTSVVIWNGSSIQNNIRQSELSSQASEMDWQQVKESTTINVILAYLQILSNQEQLTIAQKQMEVTRSQVDRLKILDAEGNISPSVLYDLKAQFANDELSALTIKNQLENAKVSLAQLMNIPYTTSLQVENISAQLIPVLYDGKPDNIYEAATKQLAYIKAADLRQKSAQKRLLSAKSQLLPTLYLSGGLGSNYSSVANHLEYLNTTDVLTSNYVNISGSKIPVYSPQNNYLSQKISYGDQLTNNLNSSISIGLQIPILNGLRARSNLNQAKIAEKYTGFVAQSAKTQLRQLIDVAYINMNSSFERYQTLARQLDDYTNSFKAAEIRFNAGVNTSVEYLLAKNNVDRTNSNFVSAKYDYLLRAKVLDFYQGKPLW